MALVAVRMFWSRRAQRRARARAARAPYYRVRVAQRAQQLARSTDALAATPCCDF